jgi:DNA polymerase mu
VASSQVVVVAFPEELPFARLTWTGSRTFNRLCRLRAIHLGLNLGPHNLTVRETGEGATVVLDARCEPPRTISLPPLGVVPNALVRTEADILRILARGTDDFEALSDPLNRNA